MFLSAFCINGLTRQKSFHFYYDFQQKSRKLFSMKVGMQQKCWKYNLQNAVDIQSYPLYELHFQWPFLYLEHLEHISRWWWWYSVWKTLKKVSLIYNMAIFLLCSGWILVFIFIPLHFSRVNLHKFYEIPSKISYIVGNPFLSVVWKSISILFLHLCQAEVEQWRKGKRGSRNLKKSLSKIRSSFPFSTCALVS